MEEKASCLEDALSHGVLRGNPSALPEEFKELLCVLSVLSCMILGSEKI
jgi:hypothetical protein